MSIRYLFETFGKKQNLYSMFIKVIESSTSSKYHVFAIFIFNIVFPKYSFIIRYLSKFLFFVSNLFQICLFIEIPIKLSIFLNLPIIFSKKELKTTKKLNIITTISIINIGGLFIIILACVIKNHGKFFKNTRNFPIVPFLDLYNNETIWVAGVGCESESIEQGRSFEDENIYISLCFFSRYSQYDGNGGVIYVKSGYYSMNVNFSMFYNCVCSKYGGAIFFESSDSCLRMICANSCSASHGHFVTLKTTNVSQVEYLSVSNCSHTTSGYNSIRLDYGDQRVDNTNSSMNSAYQNSGIGTWFPSSFTSSHCTFSNNKVSDRICIHFYSTSGTVSMSYANIVHNNSSSNYGIVDVWGMGSRQMLYCIFQNNHNMLFNVHSGSLEVYHSFIDHSSSSFSRLTTVSTGTNNSFTYRITYQLQFFNSIHCNTDIPPPSRTLDQTPIKSLEEIIGKTNEETLRMTYERTIDQTIRATQNETPYRSYFELKCTNQIAYWREISVIFSFLYPVIILIIS